MSCDWKEQHKERSTSHKLAQCCLCKIACHRLQNLDLRLACLEFRIDNLELWWFTALPRQMIRFYWIEAIFGILLSYYNALKWTTVPAPRFIIRRQLVAKVRHREERVAGRTPPQYVELEGPIHSYQRHSWDTCGWCWSRRPERVCSQPRMQGISLCYICTEEIVIASASNARSAALSPSPSCR